MAIYNVVILCAITAPVMLVIGDQQDAAFVFVASSDVFCCFLSMGLVFVPKLLFIRKHAHDPRERGGEEDERRTREEEREHREVLRDNEGLQKKLKEVRSQHYLH